MAHLDRRRSRWPAIRVGLGGNRWRQTVFERFFHIQSSAELSAWANSCALVGCLVGALVAGTLSDNLGAKSYCWLRLCFLR